MTAANAFEGQRLDRWLWFARITKSRTLAQVLIERGKVRINKERVQKTSHWLKPGDSVTISLGPKVRIFKVLGIGARRGPASEAACLYEELTPRPDRTTCSGKAGDPSLSSGAILPSSGVRESGSGRPTKRERRQTDRWKRHLDND